MYDTVAIDFDGVISSFKGWKDVGNFEDPICGVKTALEELKMAGKKIIIYTTRGEVERVRDYLICHRIPFDHINHNPQNFDHMNPGKPIADVYVDDKAICFDGEWTESFVQKILSHKPWYKKNKLDKRIDETEERLAKVLEDATQTMLVKNRQRGDCWRGSGLLGQFIEIHSMYFRLRNLIWEMDNPDISNKEWRDQAINALTDMRNYTLLAELCIEENNFKGDQYALSELQKG